MGAPIAKHLLDRLRSSGTFSEKTLRYVVTRRIQGLRHTCGFYCAYYILCLANPELYKLDIFSDNLDFNDRLVCNLFLRMFPIKWKPKLCVVLLLMHFSLLSLSPCHKHSFYSSWCLFTTTTPSTQQPASCDTHPRRSTQRYRMSHYRMARIELRQCFIGWNRVATNPPIRAQRTTHECTWWGEDIDQKHFDSLLYISVAIKASLLKFSMFSVHKNTVSNIFLEFSNYKLLIWYRLAF